MILCLALTWSSCAWPARSEAQTLVHREKVKITPPETTGPADALTLHGGLFAGNNGSVQVINADGSLNMTASIGDGTITFAKWAQNGCTTGEVPMWIDGTTKWGCSSVSGLGGLTEASSNPVLTGSWEFRNPVLIGDDITPVHLLHLYEASAQAGLRIQRGDGTAWDLLANTNFTLGTSGGTTVATFTPTGGFTLGAAAQANTITGTTTHTGDVVLNGSVGSHLTPTLPDTYDLGSSTKLWRESFISTMNAVIFAQQTATLFGGWSIIGKNAGTFYSGVSAGASTIAFGQAMTVGHFVVVRGKDTSSQYRTEYWQVGNAAPGTAPDYTYQVSQPVGAPGGYAWADGTPYLVLGTTGDGRIELNAYTTPKISILTQGATYGAQTELLRIGHLDSYYSVPSGKIGIAIGDPAQNSLTYYDGVLTIRGNGSGLTAINGGNITTGTVTADQIASRTIVAGDIATNTLTADEIAADAITASEIAADAVTASEIAANAVTASEITAGAVTAAKLESDLVVANTIRSANRTGYNTGTGFYQASNGTFGVGNSATANNLYFDGSSLFVRGTLNATDITTGTLSADRISAGTIVASKLSLNATGENLTADGSLEYGRASWGCYDNSGNEAVVCTRHDDIAGNGFSRYGRFVWYVYWYSSSQTKGIYGPLMPRGWGPYRTYTIAFWARHYGLSDPSDMAIYWNTPPVSATWVVNPLLGYGYQKYVQYITWGANVEANGLSFISIHDAAQSGAGGVWIDGIQVFDGMVDPELIGYTEAGQDIPAGAILTDMISAYAIVADKIAANAIVADKIAANAIDGKTITGATIQTASACGTSGGACLKLDTSSLRMYSGSNTVIGTVDGTGVKVNTTSSPVFTNATANGVRFAHPTVASYFGAVGMFANYDSVLDTPALTLVSTAGSGSNLAQATLLARNLTSEQDPQTGTYADAYVRVRQSANAPTVTLGTRAGAWNSEWTTATLNTTDFTVTTPYGYLQMGALNSSYAHFYTDRATYYFNKPVVAVSYFNVYGGNAILDSNQVYCTSNATCHFNYSGGGVTYVGNSSNRTYLSGGNAYFETNGDLKTPGIYNTAGTWPATGGDTHLCDAGGWIYKCSSSIRYKTAVAPATRDWTRILDLVPVEYDLKAPHPTTGREFGVIAESAESLGLFDLVTYENGQVEGFSYDKVALYLIPLVKEQRAELAQLKARVAALEGHR